MFQQSPTFLPLVKVSDFLFDNQVAGNLISREIFREHFTFKKSFKSLKNISEVFYRTNGVFGNFRSSRAEVILRKDVLKICSKLTGEHPC